MQAINIASNLTKLGSNMMQKKVQMMLALLVAQLLSLSSVKINIDRLGIYRNTIPNKQRENTSKFKVLKNA